MNLHWDDCWDRGVERMRLQRYTRADHLDIHDCDELSRSDQDRTDPEQARRRTIEEMPAHRRELAALAGRRQTAAPPPKPATVHRRTTPPRPFMSVSLNMFEPWELEELWRAARVADRSIIDRVLEEREAAEFGCA
jgi:hypothetical protein